MGEDQSPKSAIVRGAPRLEDDYLLIPQTPGLGVALVEGAQEKYPYRPVLLDTHLHVDGSVVDQ